MYYWVIKRSPINRYFVNRALLSNIGNIIDEKILYIDDKGVNKGICNKNDIQEQISHITGLELVHVGKNRDNVPIYKLLPKKQIKKSVEHVNEKVQHKSLLKNKELQISANIADHDYQVKIKKLSEFIDKGCSVQLTIFSRDAKNIEAQPGEISQDVKIIYDRIIRDLNCAKEEANSFHSSFSRIGTVLKPK